jgi:hypothetical protein
MRRVSIFLVAVALAMTAEAQPRGDRVFTARLSTMPAALGGPMMPGVGSVSATLTGTTLVVDGVFKGLDAPATAARLHKSPKPGIRGSAVFELTVTPATAGTIAARLSLTAAQVEELSQYRYYVQLDSEKAPEGQLWGWLLSPEFEVRGGPR